jgi:hypothetical protein
MTERKDKILQHMLEEIKKEETDTLNFVIPGILARAIATYMSMREDLLLVQRQTKLLLDYKKPKPEGIDKDYQDTIILALWYSTVVTYGRCFTDASKVSKPKLELKDCFNKGNQKLSEIHEFIMDLRHNFVAHRGDTDNEQEIVFMKIPKGELTGKTEYRIKSVRALSPSADRLIECISLFGHIQKIVEDKLQKQTEKVHKKFLHEFDPKEMMYFLIR